MTAEITCLKLIFDTKENFRLSLLDCTIHLPESQPPPNPALEPGQYKALDDNISPDRPRAWLAGKIVTVERFYRWAKVPYEDNLQPYYLCQIHETIPDNLSWTHRFHFKMQSLRDKGYFLPPHKTEEQLLKLQNDSRLKQMHEQMVIIAAKHLKLVQQN